MGQNRIFESSREYGVGDEQGGLAWCNSWGHEESDTTEWLNWTDIFLLSHLNPAKKHLNMVTVRRLVSLVAQTVKNLPVMEETQFWSLGWEDTLEEGMATHSSSLPGESPWTEQPGKLKYIGSHRVRQNWVTKHREMFLLIKLNSFPDFLCIMVPTHPNTGDKKP